MTESIDVRLARIEEKQDAHHEEYIRRFDQMNGRLGKNEGKVATLEQQAAVTASAPKPLSPVKAVILSSSVLGAIIGLVTIILKVIG